MNVDKAKRNIKRVMEQMKLEMCYDNSLSHTKIEGWVESLDDALAFLGD